MKPLHSVLLVIMAIPYSVTSDAKQLCDEAHLPADTPDSRFVVEAKGTVTDRQTRLMWQTCVVGLQGDDCNTGQPTRLNWEEALLHVHSINQAGGFADHRDWRLPNIRELASLTELQCTSPAINLHIFPNHPVAHSWSSSPYRFYDHYAWYLDWLDGIYIYGDRRDRKTVKLVRDIP